MAQAFADGFCTCGRTQLGQDLQSSFLSTDTAGGFQGVMLGMFAELEPTNAMPVTNAISPTINQ